MYKINIQNSIDKQKQIKILDGEKIVDQNGDVIKQKQIDENGQVVVDELGNPVLKPLLNTTGKEQTLLINKTNEEIAAEEKALIIKKEKEIKIKINEYKKKQEYQRQNGGPGPVADFEIMKICNQYSGEFEVIIEE